MRLDAGSEGGAIFNEDSVNVVKLPAHTNDCGDGWLGIVGGDEAISATAEQEAFTPNATVEIVYYLNWSC